MGVNLRFVSVFFTLMTYAGGFSQHSSVAGLPWPVCLHFTDILAFAPKAAHLDGQSDSASTSTSSLVQAHAGGDILLSICFTQGSHHKQHKSIRQTTLNTCQIAQKIHQTTPFLIQTKQTPFMPGFEIIKTKDSTKSPARGSELFKRTWTKVHARSHGLR